MSGYKNGTKNGTKNGSKSDMDISDTYTSCNGHMLADIDTLM